MGWHPSQLRHSAATEIRKQFGLEAAQVALGQAIRSRPRGGWGQSPINHGGRRARRRGIPKADVAQNLLDYHALGWFDEDDLIEAAYCPRSETAGLCH